MSVGVSVRTGGGGGVWTVSYCLVYCSVAGLQETTLTVTEKAVKEVMKLDDEIFSKFYRRVAEFPHIPSRIEINEDFDSIFGSQGPV